MFTSVLVSALIGWVGPLPWACLPVGVLDVHDGCGNPLAFFPRISSGVFIIAPCYRLAFLLITLFPRFPGLLFHPFALDPGQELLIPIALLAILVQPVEHKFIQTAGSKFGR